MAIFHKKTRKNTNFNEKTSFLTKKTQKSAKKVQKTQKVHFKFLLPDLPKP